MNQPHQSKRIRELIFQINKFTERVKNPPKKDPKARLSDIKRLKNLENQLVLQQAIEAPTLEEAKEILNKNPNISWATKNSITLQNEIEPSAPEVLTGEDILNVVPYPTKDFYEAVRHYSADTENEESYYRKINKSLRDPNAPLTKHSWVKTRDQLLNMFEKASPLKKSIRLYRGVPLWIAENILELGFYLDAGFSSCSTDLGVAIAYSGESRCILVIDIKENTKGLVSIGDLSRNPHEREVLLQNGLFLSFVGSKITLEGFRIIYLSVGELS